MAEQFNTAEEIWPQLEKLYLGHGWQGRLFGLKRWLKAGFARNIAPGATSVIAVRDAGKTPDALAPLRGHKSALILVEKMAAGGKLPPPHPLASVHLLLDAETPLLTARNIGAGVSTGELLVFIAGDGKPEDDFLPAYERAFQEFPQTLACRGRIVSQYLDEPAAVTGSFRLPGEIDLWPVDLEENMAVRSDIFFALGGFDEAMLPGYGALDFSIRLFGKYPDFSLQRHVPAARLEWNDPAAQGLPFAEYLFLRQRSWLELNETMKTYLALYARFWRDRAPESLGEAAHV